MSSREKSLTETLRLPAGPVDLSAHAADDTPGFGGSKNDGKDALADLEDPLSELQERLFAEGVSGGRRSLLLVLQGMDTSGKGGVMRHAAGLVDPQGLHINAFKAPTEEERGHDFLWRISKELPPAGKIGIFDRSHYEDVLIARVRALVPLERIDLRYDAINDFEKRLVDEGTVVVKCMLHISPEKQLERLLERLDSPEKHWKYNPGDVDERALWPSYRDAYELMLERCNTDDAPWLLVPADRKWYRNWAVATVLHEALEGMKLKWPEADFDVDTERQRLTELKL
ncbi:PPK2 family polyphosphate kinase [Nocardioides mesophilus]|uniref:Polyphosphate kinase 2 family protein n=1 Tax=Nocardioides mesophilus TaxID=433659 RepID=A0A7G9RA31_9ACTN|nr:PPK2 family polyphosphate kinase [Nocardioides mesophilus]QNN52456.1 polyphosphate kinase 2 family protein [Nocardioides mesophilus]